MFEVDMTEESKYTETAVHFYVDRLPPLMETHLKPGPLVLADLGCGDGPFFQALQKRGFIGPTRLVYAVDLEEHRLNRISKRFPYIVTLIAPADCVPEIQTNTVDFVISTMVMEHVPDELKFLTEIKRILKPDGKAFITTVYKKKWAWYFRKRNGESVLDTSHLREYTDLNSFRSLVERSGLTILQIETRPMWFPVIDPLAFRLFPGKNTVFNNPILRLIRSIKVPVMGYYSLNMVLGP